MVSYFPFECTVWEVVDELEVGVVTSLSAVVLYLFVGPGVADKRVALARKVVIVGILSAAAEFAVENREVVKQAATVRIVFHPLVLVARQ